MVVGGVFEDFFQSRDAFAGFFDADHAEGFHSFGDGLIFDHRRGGALDDEAANLFRNGKDLDDGYPSHVASAFAAVTASALVKGR